MEIYNIEVQSEGYVYCKSNFYSAQNEISQDSHCTFSVGINKLTGEIDSGNWAISYLLSMYQYRPEDFILFEQPKVIINDKLCSFDEISAISCYMDKLYPLFSSDDTVKNLVSKGLEYSKINYSVNDIKELFNINDQRFERALKGVGNEIFKAMAAIGFSYNKEIFCFPWLSNMRFESYHANLTDLLQTLGSLKKIVIIPMGKR